jgi:hypothetical protein
MPTRARDIRRRARPPETPLTIEEAAALAPDDTEFFDREAETVARIKGSLGQGTPESDFEIKVYRKTPGANRSTVNEFLFNCGIDELSNLLVRVRDEYGAGKYRFHVLKNGQSFGEFHQHIALPKNAFTGRGIPTGAPAGANGFESLFAGMMDRQEKMFSAMMDRMNAPPPAAAPAAPGMTVKEVIESFVLLQGLAPKPQPAEPKIVEVFQQGVELALKLGQAAGATVESESGVMGLVREVIRSPAIAGAMQRALTPPAAPGPMPGPLPARPGGQPPAPPARAPTPAAAAPVAPPPNGGAPPFLAQLAPGIAYLTSKAAEGADPELFVDWLTDNVPEIVWQELERRDDPLAFLIGHFPAMAPYSAWFGRLLELCYEPAGNEGGAANDVSVPQPEPA